MVRETLVIGRLDPSGPRHPDQDTTGVTLTYGYWI
jgi:hypothetical protein